jgi:hypothetical protein
VTLTQSVETRNLIREKSILMATGAIGLIGPGLDTLVAAAIAIAEDYPGEADMLDQADRILDQARAIEVAVFDVLDNRLPDMADAMQNHSWCPIVARQLKGVLNEVRPLSQSLAAANIIVEAREVVREARTANQNTEWN